MFNIILASVIVGILKTIQVKAELRCTQCDHIDWNDTLTFDNVQYIYYLLLGKYNPACTLEDPRDRDEYEQYFLRYQRLYDEQQQQQYTGQQNHSQQRLTWDNYKQRYDVRTSICQVQCTYVYGDVIVYFNPFQEKMKLNIHWRSCLNKLSSVRDGCYQRDTNYGYTDIKMMINRKLQFLGSGVVDVLHFVGYQCYCSSDYCHPVTHSSSNKAALSSSLAIIVYTYLVLLHRHIYYWGAYVIL